MELNYLFLGLTVLLFFFVFRFLRSFYITTDLKYNGIKQLKEKPDEDEKFIIIHGIGPQKDDYSIKMIKRLAKYSLGGGYSLKYHFLDGKKGKLVDIGGVNILDSMNLHSNGNEIRLLKVEASSANGNKNNTYYSINWAVLADSFKKKLINEEFSTGPFFMGLNKFLKRMIMMERVSDAFNGSNPVTIKKFVETIDFVIRDGKFKDEKNVNLISGSFGSQLFIGAMVLYGTPALNKASKNILAEDDSVINYLSRGRLHSLPEKAEYAAIRDFVQESKSKNLNMFMLTNQINLMSQNISGWFAGINSNELQLLSFSKIQVVAFRNPRDILCYYLPKKCVESLFKGFTPENIHVVNAHYFNLRPFGNNVGTAHTSVFKLGKLAKAIYYGTDSCRVKIKKRKAK